MTVFYKLAKRLRKDLGLEVDPASFRRTYAGKWLKAGGAFSWTCRLKDNGIVESVVVGRHQSYSRAKVR